MSDRPIGPLEERLLDYVEGELSDAQRRDIEAALADEPQLRQRVERMLADRQGLRQLPREQSPRDFVDEVMQQRERALLLGEPDVAPDDERVEAHRTLRLSRAVSYAAIAAVLLICASLMVMTLLPGSLLERVTQYASTEQPGTTGTQLDGQTLAMESAPAEEVPPLPRRAEPPRPAPIGAAPTPPMDDRGRDDALESLLSEARQRRGLQEAEAPMAAAAPAAQPATEVADEDGLAAADATDPQIAADMRQLGQLSGRVMRPGAALVSLNQEPVRSQLVVHTADLEQTAEQVRQWAVTNRITVLDAEPAEAQRVAKVEPYAADGPLGSAGIQTEAKLGVGLSRDRSAEAEASTRQAVVLIVPEQRQVADLVTRLNLASGQRAAITAGQLSAAQFQPLVVREARRDAGQHDVLAFRSILESQLPLIEPTPVEVYLPAPPVRLEVLIEQGS